MVKHIILWKLKEELSENEKDKVKEDAKKELEGLLGKIPGLMSMSVQIDSISSSSADMMLYSEFVNEEALNNYKGHPEHVRVADNYVRPYTVERLCLDFMA